MSDFEDSDGDFDDLRLVSSTPFVGDSSTPLKNDKNFEAKFSASFLEANLFGNGGFGDKNSSEIEENSENEPKEELVGLDWDASQIFKNLACPESKNENTVCVLRLHDILTKSELAIQKMTRQMINCGRLINSQTAENRRDMGFQDSHNVQNLRRMLASLRGNTQIMMVEIQDLEELIEPKFHSGNGQKSTWTVPICIGIGILAPLALVLWHKYR